jgi:hypothetical protein
MMKHLQAALKDKPQHNHINWIRNQEKHGNSCEQRNKRAKEQSNIHLSNIYKISGILYANKSLDHGMNRQINASY